jgi:aldehyde dehydrogenase (NAD+)
MLPKSSPGAPPPGGGQWCTSPGYAYVHESVVQTFVNEAKALIELYGEDPESNPDYSRIAGPSKVSRFIDLVDPSKVIVGGRGDPEARYFDPTILYPITWDVTIMAEEIFGPILPVMSYRTLDEAMKPIAIRPRPLSAFVFSRDQKTVDRVIGWLSFGGGAVNQTNVHLFVESMPFGGVGASGMGHYHGKFGFETLTHAKSILVSPPDASIEHLFPPFTPEKVEAVQQWFEFLSARAAKGLRPGVATENVTGPRQCATACSKTWLHRRRAAPAIRVETGFR